MKKLVFALFMAVMPVFALNAAETPRSIYDKMIGKGFSGKFDTLIIDKKIYSSQLPKGMAVESKTYFSDGKFREETSVTDEKGQKMFIVTVFTSSDTFVSYDSGQNYFALGESFIEQVSANLKEIEPFTPLAQLSPKTEKANGK